MISYNIRNRVFNKLPKIKECQYCQHCFGCLIKKQTTKSMKAATVECDPFLYTVLSNFKFTNIIYSPNVEENCKYMRIQS